MKHVQTGLKLDLPPAAATDPRAFCANLPFPANEPKALQ
jgi:hypothetical protein